MSPTLRSYALEMVSALDMKDIKHILQTHPGIKLKLHERRFAGSVTYSKQFHFLLSDTPPSPSPELLDGVFCPSALVLSPPP